jgi:uncharacterized protein YmfQ (DUF2313 family)
MKTTNAGVDVKVQEKEPSCTLVGMQIRAVTMEVSMEVLQKTKNRATVSLPGIFPKECKSAYKRCLHTCVSCSTIYSGQALESF